MRIGQSRSPLQNQPSLACSQLRDLTRILNSYGFGSNILPNSISSLQFYFHPKILIFHSLTQGDGDFTLCSHVPRYCGVLQPHREVLLGDFNTRTNTHQVPLLYFHYEPILRPNVDTDETRISRVSQDKRTIKKPSAHATEKHIHASHHIDYAS